jgi:hypothetical protein
MNSTFADLVHVIELAACGKNYLKKNMQLAETIVVSQHFKLLIIAVSRKYIGNYAG